MPLVAMRDATSCSRKTVLVTPLTADHYNRNRPPCQLEHLAGRFFYAPQALTQWATSGTNDALSEVGGTLKRSQGTGSILLSQNLHPLPLDFFFSGLIPSSPTEQRAFSSPLRRLASINPEPLFITPFHSHENASELVAL